MNGKDWAPVDAAIAAHGRHLAECTITGEGHANGLCHTGNALRALVIEAARDAGAQTIDDNDAETERAIAEHELMIAEQEGAII